MTALADLDRIIANLDADSSAESLREALQAVRDKMLSTQAMADCMAYVRDELVRAGIVSKDVPPMFIPEAVAEAMNSMQRTALTEHDE